MRMPAVVVGDHGDGHVTEFGFAGELRFLQVGHADDVHAKAAIDVGLGFSGKLWPFHAAVGAAVLACHADLLAGLLDDSRKLSADGIGEADVGDDSVAEKSVDAVAGAVEELVRNNEIERLVLLFEGSDGRDRDDALDAELLESVNIGAEVEFAGRQNVSATVPGEECDFSAFERSADIGVGRGAERRAEFYFFDLGEAGHGIEPAAADDSDLCLSQTSSSVVRKA